MIEYLGNNGTEVNRHTIMRDIEQLQNCGIDIICQRSRMNQYFIGERILEIPELKLLIDAVDAARFIPLQKSTALVEKLTGLVSKYEAEQLKRNIYVGGRVKSNNLSIYYYIDTINEAINTGKKITFQYYTYLPTKEKTLRYNGYTYSFSPHRITWNMDSYYVLGFYQKRGIEMVYRIDRMTSLEIIDETASPIPDDFNIDTFLKATFLMYDGEEKRVTLVCKSDVMNSVIDKFGEDVETQYNPETDKEHFIAIVDAEIGPTFYSWVFNYKGKIKIIDPQEVVDGYINMLREQLNQ